ncbi:peptidyl-tRNA hydrolase [Metschnikowia bicuspidata]|uniref:peptidyl-tRNA hydrolase n=1 Tax=Metschnikowia bicuspidata TaxID=27322 RepID=A0A4P9ZIR4_9ASCO|nr:peptidyl-tRNA hydrolase [Metschnikowia bicuspidata]
MNLTHVLRRKRVLVIGLGNPSPAFDRTRHNVGTWLGDQLVKLRWNGFLGFKPDQRSKTVHVSTSSDTRYAHVTLAKVVGTYMNVLGAPVLKLWAQFKKESSDGLQLVIVHDDLERDVGKVQVRGGATSARGHNGLRSINAAIGPKYTKMGLGIGRPATKLDRMVVGYVLGKFTQQETAVLENETLVRAAELLDQLVREE